MIREADLGLGGAEMGDHGQVPGPGSLEKNPRGTAHCPALSTVHPSLVERRQGEAGRPAFVSTGAGGSGVRGSVEKGGWGGERRLRGDPSITCVIQPLLHEDKFCFLKAE